MFYYHRLTHSLSFIIFSASHVHFSACPFLELVHYHCRPYLVFLPKLYFLTIPHLSRTCSHLTPALFTQVLFKSSATTFNFYYDIARPAVDTTFHKPSYFTRQPVKSQLRPPRIIPNCSRHHFKSALFTLNPLSPQRHPPFVFITSKAPQRRPLIPRPVLATNMFSRELPDIFFFNCFSPMDKLLLRKEQVARPSKSSVEIWSFIWHNF